MSIINPDIVGVYLEVVVQLAILELEHEGDCCIPGAEFNHAAVFVVGANHLDWQWIEYIAIGVVFKWFAIAAYLYWVSILVQLEDAIWTLVLLEQIPMCLHLLHARAHNRVHQKRIEAAACADNLWVLALVDECGVVLENLHIVQVSHLALQHIVYVEGWKPGHQVSEGLGFLAYLEGQPSALDVEVVEVAEGHFLCQMRPLESTNGWDWIGWSILLEVVKSPSPWFY